MICLICLKELHSLEAPTSFFLQLQLEGGSDPLYFQATTRGKLQLPNSLSKTPYVLWLQPEGGYNHLSLPHLIRLLVYVIRLIIHFT
jgi:hypothetical protein